MADSPEYIAKLAAKMNEPHVQALADSWPDPDAETLAFIARIFAGAGRRIAERRAAAASSAAPSKKEEAA